MKALIISFLTAMLYLTSCEKMDDPITTPTSPSKLIQHPTNKDSTNSGIEKDTFQFSNSHLGIYKGVCVSGKTTGGIIVIEQISDTLGTAFITLNKTRHTLDFKSANLVSKSKKFIYNNSDIQLTLTYNYTSANATVNIDYNNLIFYATVLKESADDTVLLFEGTWISEVKTPINRFEERGIWNLAHNKSTIVGSNGEGFIKGTISENGYSGTHPNGGFNGSKTVDQLNGVFDWRAYGLSGIGSWTATQTIVSPFPEK